MYCTKCGTEQHEGQKFCPKCGTPFLDESQKLSPEMTANERGWAIYSIGKAGEQVTEERIRYYVQRQREDRAMQQKEQGNNIGDNSQIQSSIPNGVNDNSYHMYSETNPQSTKERIESKAEELSMKGKRLIDENVRPHFDKGVENLKSVNWDDQMKQAASFVKEFISTPNKIGMVTKVATSLFALLFLLKEGFSCSIIWYVVLVVMLYVAFKGIPIIKKEGLISQYINSASCIFFMLIIGLGATKDSANHSLGELWSSSENKGPHELCIYNDATIIGNKGWMKFDIIESNGNYNVHDTSHGSLIVTDIITIPKGEKWKFDRDESTCEGDFYSPQVCLYHGGDENDLNNYRCYTTEKISNMPIFTSGDKIVIKIPLSIFPNKRMTLHLKVYFIKTNDEFAM